MPITGLDRMPGSGLARGTLFDKELNVTEVTVPYITATTALIFEKSAENKYTITWTQPTGDKSLQLRAMDAVTDYFVFENATQTLTYKELGTGTTITAGTIRGITDLEVAVASSTTLFGDLASNTLVLGTGTSTIQIMGNLTVSGSNTIIDTTTLITSDNLIYLNQDYTIEDPAQDSGLLINRGGTEANVAMVWDESEDEFVMATTTQLHDATIVTPASYVNLHVGGLTLKDNQAIALDIKEPSETAPNSYMKFITTNGSEKILLGVEIEGGNFDIDGGDIATAVVINKSPAITLGGDLSGNLTLTELAGGTLTATIEATSVEGSMLHDNAISGQAELGEAISTTDELLLSNGGVLNRMAMSVLYAQSATLSNKSIDLETNPLTGTITEFNTALQSESFATLGGTEILAAKTLTTPTIVAAGWTNANHTHAGGTTGGTISAQALTGNYVATITGGVGITSSAATTGASTTHSLSVDESLGHITTLGTALVTTDIAAGDLTMYNPVNNGNPTISLGSAAAERLIITANYASGVQTLDSIEFATAVASGDADKGKMIFDVDGTDILTIVDAGLLIKDTGTIGPVGDTDLITLTASGNLVEIAGALTVTGNLIVSGTSTTVNSTTMTVVDPIITLQTASGGGALGGDSNLDVGIAMQYHTGSAAKTAFLGFDDTDSKLMYVPDASISSEVVSGSIGTIKANLEGTIGAANATTIVGTTINATTNFTIGDTVVTNGVVTDSTGLQLLANLDIDGTADISGDLTLSAGGDGALRFSGASSIKILDDSATALVIEEADNAYITFDTRNGAEKILISKAVEFDGALDIDGAVQLDSTFTVGVNDAGHDVKFFGDTASAYILWDTDADKLLTAGTAVIDIVKDKLLIGGTAVTTTAAELNYSDTGAVVGTVVASKVVTVDASKDVGDFRNVTLTGDLVAANLDISVNVDVDGTLEADIITVNGTALNTVIAGVTVTNATLAAGATVLATARNIGGVSFNGSAPINLPGVNIAGNQATSGLAATATLANTVAVLDTNATTAYVGLFDSATGSLPAKTDVAMTYNAVTGTLYVTNMEVSGTTTTSNTTITSTTDSMFKYASGNDADAVDFGFYGKYVDSGTKYSGLFRDASDSDKWKLFATTGNSDAEPTGTVNTASAFTLATLAVASLEGTIATAAQNSITSASTLATVGTITTGEWRGTDVGVAYGGTGVSTLAANSLLTGNGTSAIVAEANLTFDGSTLTLDGDLTFTGAQAIATSAGNLSINTVAGSAIRLNDTQVNTDVVIESDAADNLTHWDASTGSIGINRAATANHLVAIGGTFAGSAGTDSASLLVNPTMTMAVDNSESIVKISGTLTEAGSGTHAIIAGLHVHPPVVGTGSAAVTNAATVYIQNAINASGANNYALFVDAGDSRFDGNVLIGGTAFSDNKIFDAGGITIGLAASSPAPDNNSLHLWGGTAGSITAGWGLLVIEDDTHTYVTFLTPNDAESGLRFGDPQSSSAGRLIYRNSDDSMMIGPLSNESFVAAYGLKVGGEADRSSTEPTKGVTLFNGIAPAGTLANGFTLYSASGQMNTMDSAGVRMRMSGGTIDSSSGAISFSDENLTTTGLISGGSLDIDDVVINGTNIGHTDDTDLLALTSQTLTVSGHIMPSHDNSFDIGDVNAAWKNIWIQGDIRMTDAGTIATDAGDLTLSPTGKLYTAADFGVGVTASDQLHVLASKGTGGSPYNGGLRIDDDTAVATGVGGGIFLYGKYSGNTKTIFANIHAFKHDGTANYEGDLAFGTRVQGGNCTEKMRILYNGNVGMGESTPTAKLHLVPDVNSYGLKIVGPTHTAFQRAISVTETWNANNVGFQSIYVNVVDTASDASAELLHLGVSGTSKFSVRKDGKVTVPGVLDLNSTGTLLNVGASSCNWTATTLNISRAYDGDLSLQVWNTDTDASHTGANAMIYLVCFGDEGDTKIQYGTGVNYAHGIDHSEDRWVLSANHSLGTTDAIRVTTGAAITFNNSTGSDFDYVCDGCGKSSLEMFTCCGKVEWHDDVLALRESRLSPEGIAHMTKLGILEIDGPDDADPGWMGINYQKAQNFTWAGMWQNRQRMDAQYDEHESRFGDKIRKLETLLKKMLGEKEYTLLMDTID